MLGGYRVLDLAGEGAAFAGRILADLGADVVKVEPPSGDPARTLGPFWHDEPHREKSLFWSPYNAGKRSVTLDLEREDGRALLRPLVGAADFLVESFKPGYLDGLGLGYKALSRLNPRLIMASMSPFGSEGPYAQYEGSDLVGMAMGGFMYTHGDSDRPPVSFSHPQAYLHGGAEAAAACMLAHSWRERTGQGQHVDVSIQEAVIWTLQNAAWFWDLQRVNLKRSGAVRRRADGVMVRTIWPCKEGHIMFPLGSQYAAMARWMDEEGVLEPRFKGRDFSMLDTQHSSQAELSELVPSFTRFFKTKTAWEMYEGAVKRRIMLMPVSSIADVVGYRQLKERQAFVEVEHPDLGAVVTYPGTFIRTTAASPRLCGRPPRLGEHSEAIYVGELGLSRGEMGALKAWGAI